MAKARGLPFDALCGFAGLPVPVAEYRFHPTRKWRFDWAWPEQRVALEVQGGIFSSGRHVRGAALLKEYEKLNTAARLGWRVFYCTPAQLTNGEILDDVAGAL